MRKPLAVISLLVMLLLCTAVFAVSLFYFNCSRSISEYIRDVLNDGSAVMYMGGVPIVSRQLTETAAACISGASPGVAGVLLQGILKWLSVSLKQKLPSERRCMRIPITMYSMAYLLAGVIAGLSAAGKYVLMGCCSLIGNTELSEYTRIAVILYVILLIGGRKIDGVINGNLYKAGEYGAKKRRGEALTVAGVAVMTVTLGIISLRISGCIWWTGVLIPLAVRKLYVNDYRLQIPASMLLGAIFVLSCDLINRSISIVVTPISYITGVAAMILFFGRTVSKTFWDAKNGVAGT